MRLCSLLFLKVHKEIHVPTFLMHIRKSPKVEDSLLVPVPFFTTNSYSNSAYYISGTCLFPYHFVDDNLVRQYPSLRCFLFSHSQYEDSLIPTSFIEFFLLRVVTTAVSIVYRKLLSLLCGNICSRTFVPFGS